MTIYLSKIKIIVSLMIILDISIKCFVIRCRCSIDFCKTILQIPVKLHFLYQYRVLYKYVQAHL